MTELEMLQSVITQFYKNRDTPDTIYISEKITQEASHDFKLIEDYLNNNSNKATKTKIENPSSEYSKMMNIVLENAKIQLERNVEQLYKWKADFATLQKLFGLEKPITRVEIYDNSHLYGTFSLGVMIVAKESGFTKNNYKIFNLKNTNIKSNDDYGILREVFMRRFSKLTNEDKPNLVLIDGGKGQLSVALQVAKELNLQGIKFVAVAKGVERNAGNEVLFEDTNPNEPIKLDKFSSTLHFIQMLRNEAHRFAIGNVRKRQIKSSTQSTLDLISGIGKARKKDLLEHFTSIDSIKNASLEELQSVKGINKAVALKIYEWFRA
jgi:excinuclease ABC subunit C